MSKKESISWAEEYFNISNYISASSIYLKDNFLLEKPLKKDDIKDSLLGHWGTCPGINFIYTHLNLLAYEKKQQILLVVGPGHGAAAVLSNLFLEGSLEKYYPKFKRDKQGLGNLIKSFCWPEGFPSHVYPGLPGSIHEGGELGYALATAFGAAFDNPNLIVTAIIGDGEAETGPTATAWHSSKFINPKEDGAVLPILHLNGYKISNPSIYGTMSDEELKKLFEGYGYEPVFVNVKHEEMINAMEYCYSKIKKIQNSARQNNNIEKPAWPMIIFKSLKGWTGPKYFESKKIEGSYRSHQVPLKNVKSNDEELKALENWLRSYNPEKRIPNGTIPSSALKFVPKGDFRIGSNPNSFGGNIIKDLILPNAKKFSISFDNDERGNTFSGSTSVLGKYLKEVITLNEKSKNFRIFSPDELESNKLGDVLEATGRRYYWPHSKEDNTLSKDGRVMEILSEHTLQSWFQGYVLTGRHGIFPSYEAFLPIIDSMVSQYLKFIELSEKFKWRKPVSSLNYLLTSVCWRQDHNGFSHQNPGFINTLLNKAKEEHNIRIYFPADTNSLLVTSEDCLKSKNRVNLIVSDKQLIRQWLSYEEAKEQFKSGAMTWKFASSKNPDIVLAACGDYQTQETLSAISLLKKDIPEIKIKFVNVNELNVLGKEEFYPNSLTDLEFEKLFEKDREVVFSFHGYPGAVKQLLFDRKNNERFHIYGYIEQGTTTTPFDMLIRNNISRYHIAIRALTHASKHNSKVASKSKALISKLRDKIKEHKMYIINNGVDPGEINEWTW